MRENSAYLSEFDSPFLSYCMVCDQQIPSNSKSTRQSTYNSFGVQTQTVAENSSKHSIKSGLNLVYCSSECEAKDYDSGYIDEPPYISNFWRPDSTDDHYQYIADRNQHNSDSESPETSGSGLFQSQQQRQQQEHMYHNNSDPQHLSYPQIRLAAYPNEENYYHLGDSHNLKSLSLFQNSNSNQSDSDRFSSLNNNYYLSAFSVSSHDGLPHYSASPASYAGANYKKFRSLSIGEPQFQELSKLKVRQ
ncbi:hypothetical protein NADFUDRAFT_81792 [Nadsonia fulvescens var. elongata DSM 6958]|uniref:Uncharacterized protein n=1 Tax=Nadsonia fulvescens var. elongata DSM 6958 TaxID=857566 RepID=A0A1E3PP79_9ASCO|nr:hypothetical protein NADFUDRAFT_81792 [Nadsonia fulvescens var. elongata DSM 6958]